MRFRRFAIASVIGLSLVTCTACSVTDLDPNGDGEITEMEFLAAAFDFVCGDHDEEVEEPDTDTPEEPEVTDPDTPDDGTSSEEEPATAANRSQPRQSRR
jgi:hypothetical protein